MKIYHTISEVAKCQSSLQELNSKHELLKEKRVIYLEQLNTLMSEQKQLLIDLERENNDDEINFTLHDRCSHDKSKRKKRKSLEHLSQIILRKNMKNL